MRIAGLYTKRCKVCGAEVQAHRFGAYCRDCYNAKIRDTKKKKLEALQKNAMLEPAHTLSAVAAEANRRHMTYGKLVALERCAP